MLQGYFVMSIYIYIYIYIDKRDATNNFVFTALETFPLSIEDNFLKILPSSSSKTLQERSGTLECFLKP